MTAIPQSLKLEHHELHEELARATREPGAVGEAARGVAKALHPHFVREEEFAMPPLGALAAVAHGEKVADAPAVIAQARRVADELPQMLAEHRTIVGALERLEKAAREAGNHAVLHFAEKLKLHAQTEEEVLYPAAILVGRALEAMNLATVKDSERRQNVEPARRSISS